MTPQQMMLDLNIRQEEYLLHLEEPFGPIIAKPWFDTIVLPDGPTLMAAERLGPKWFLADLTKAYYSWDNRMKVTESTPAHEDVGLFRAISTAFGCAVVMGSLLQFQPDWDLAHDDTSPSDDIGTLLEAFWDTDEKMHELGPTIALRAAINMFRQADDE